MLNWLLQLLSALVPGVRRLRADVDALQAQMEDVMTRQEQIEAANAKLTAALAGIKADVDDLKSKLDPGSIVSQETADAVAALADKFAELDAAYPQAPADGGNG